MKNTLIVLASLVVVFLLGRWTKNFDPVKIVQYDTLPPVVHLDTIRDTVPVPKYVHIVRYDTIHDTADGKPIHLPIPISRYLFTDDSTYRMEVEGYNVQANSIEVYPPDGYTNRYPAGRGSRQAETLGDRRERRGSFNARGGKAVCGVGVQYQLIAL